MTCAKSVRACLFLFFLALCGLGSMPVARAAECSPEMSRRAVALLPDASDSWSSLLRHQTTFLPCDDGELGEGYSAAVAYLFSSKWGQLEVFLDIAKENPDFGRWAMHHIDATASDEELNSIISNANSCAGGIVKRKICNSIKNYAKDALIESRRMRGAR
ncbi:hypothetical protein [Ralstonia sp. NFACC01]|jgi:hypothetical protein|uniref:hypothetical protein n=1 Tax=Ralstonia sp. NFACC01 TaxID=1566294 RepID=UPI0011138D62|nr:hypothetical protein [Ralstonia sp. NFACC01]